MLTSAELAELERRAAGLDSDSSAQKLQTTAKEAPRGQKAPIRGQSVADLSGILPSSLEELVCGERFGGLLEASDLQRAILRAADGHPTGLEPSLERRWFGRNLGAHQVPRPDAVGLVTGVRGGKSRIAAGGTVWGALTADLSGIDTTEEVRSVVLAPTGDLCGQTIAWCKALVANPSPLASLVSGKMLASSFVLRRPDGYEVEIVVSAASSSGTSVRSRWLATLCLEEAAFFGIEAKGYAVNAEEIYRAALPRLRHQAWTISSPRGPEGFLYELWKQGHQKHTRGLVVCHARTRDMNPSFPEEKIAAARALDPDTAAREYDAAWTDAETSLLPSAWVDACTRLLEGDAARLPGARYVAAMDPASRGNGWTLAIGTRAESRVVVAAVREWVGSKAHPLDMAAVLREMQPLLVAYGVTSVESDQWAGDALVALGRTVGVSIVVWPATQADNWQMADDFRVALGALGVELPRDATVREDLLGAKRHLTPSGNRLHLPRTANGRHCDHVPSITRMFRRASTLQPWQPPLPPAQQAVRDLEDFLEGDARAHGGERAKNWWKR